MNVVVEANMLTVSKGIMPFGAQRGVHQRQLTPYIT